MKIITIITVLICAISFISGYSINGRSSVVSNEKNLKSLTVSIRDSFVLNAVPSDNKEAEVRTGLAKLTDSWLFSGMEATAVFALLSAVDGAYSGDWVRYGLIDTAFENQLKFIVTTAGFLHIICGALGGYLASKRNQPVVPAALHALLIGVLGVAKVYYQSDARPISYPSIKGLKQSITSLFAGSYDVEAINDKIDQDLNAPVLMYSFTKCPYCIKAKSILIEKYKANIKVVELDENKKEGNAIRLELSKRTGRTSVPSIWLNGQHIGGCNDGPKELKQKSGKSFSTKGGVAALDQEGQLRNLLLEAGAIKK